MITFFKRDKKKKAMTLQQTQWKGNTVYSGKTERSGRLPAELKRTEGSDLQ